MSVVQIVALPTQVMIIELSLGTHTMRTCVAVVQTRRKYITAMMYLCRIHLNNTDKREKKKHFQFA